MKFSIFNYRSIFKLFLIQFPTLALGHIFTSCDFFSRYNNAKKPIIVGISGRELNEENKSYLKKTAENFDIVGVILNTCNTKIYKTSPDTGLEIEDKELVQKIKEEKGELKYLEETRKEISKFTQDLKVFVKTLYENKNTENKQDIIICADVEGGVVNRISNLILFPNQKEMCELYYNDREEFEKIIKTVAKEMSDLGFTHNLAPVVDLDCDFYKTSGRSFCKDEIKIEEIVKAIIDIYLENDITPVLKHAPGLHFLTKSSNTEHDTHIAACYSENSLHEIETHLKLYKALASHIRSKNKIPHIMLNHGVYNCIDKDQSASISKKVIKLIRETVSPKGEPLIFVTDCMNMGGVYPSYTIEDYKSGKLELPKGVIPIFVHDWRGPDFVGYKNTKKSI